jgi:transposase
MRKSITHVGLDVHKDTIVGAVLPPDVDRCTEEKRLPFDVTRLVKWLRRLERKHGELRVCYEAGGGGYVLVRDLEKRRIRCEVAAPSLIPRKPGERRKTDRLDARDLAMQYRAGALTMVHVPDREDEGLRALVRLRRSLVRELTRSKHQVIDHTRRNGLVFQGKSNWTKAHWSWLESLALAPSDEQFVLRVLLERVQYAEAQLAEVNGRIRERAYSESYVDRTGRLMCLKAFDVTGATVMTAEVGDFTRFPTAESFMSWTGVVPGIHQSGGTRRTGVGITKAGNSHCRHILIQASWVIVQRPPRAGRRLREQWKGQPAWVVRHSQRAMKRLHQKYWRMVRGGKLPQKAITAVARELAGFVWAVMQESAVADCREAAA